MVPMVYRALLDWHRETRFWIETTPPFPTYPPFPSLSLLSVQFLCFFVIVISIFLSHCCCCCCCYYFNKIKTNPKLLPRVVGQVSGVISSLSPLKTRRPRDQHFFMSAVGAGCCRVAHTPRGPHTQRRLLISFWNHKDAQNPLLTHTDTQTHTRNMNSKCYMTIRAGVIETCEWFGATLWH